MLKKGLLSNGWKLLRIFDLGYMESCLAFEVTFAPEIEKILVFFPLDPTVSCDCRKRWDNN